ncbi:N-acetylneuraminate (7)9-O-acetyltransferase-like isoform X2 [Mytilus edulis]|uniref:N-acetylneuraminate (7)9-O-acetyltransferase-like isoform X2 n=1 Tax=Mytilus edulis TaxID=6550 RepID=UPI0039EF1C75
MAEQQRPTTTHEITYYLNIENAKIIALFMVTGFLMYHGVIHLKYSNDTCKWLLSDGRFPGYNTWQPYGCMMHKYTKSDARMCMHYISYWGKRNHIAFLGDSRIRQLYYEFVNLLSNEPVKNYKAHTNLHFKDDEIKVSADFLWHPMVNTSMFYVYKSWLMNEPLNRPNQIITGSATWSIKLNNASEDALKNFQVNLTMIQPLFKNLKADKNTDIIWMLQDPVDENRLGLNRSMITNRQIDQYNKVAIDLLDESQAKVWSSSRLVAQGIRQPAKNIPDDGLHISKPALQLDVQILLNMYCNDHMNYNDGTCCRSPEAATTVQIITSAFFLVCFVSAIALFVYKRRLPRNGIKPRTENGNKNGAPKEPYEALYEVTVSLAKLGMIMGYVYLCDRTNFFMKENKYYTHVNFFLPFAYVMILGFFFTESTEQTVVLHRDQTDEWKGWMQLVILIYHLTGASKVLPIYMQIRVLVSSYLFLTGFGHFSFFWKKGEYSLYRCSMVLFRLNFLVIVLCFVMNRPYQFYYFVPLVSYWFLVVYVTMAIWPHVTAASTEAGKVHYFYMVAKFVILITLIALFYMSEVFFDKVFLLRPIKSLFVLQDDSISEWRFRWSLDRYSVVYGMVFGFVYELAKKYKFIDDSNNENLFSRIFSSFVVFLGLLGLGSYVIFTFLCKNKVECNQFHSYLTIVPIISFILIRNVPGWLRTKYSSFFAWFGKISLELFISQYHIWLAADTHGVLVLIPSYPVLNVIITSFIFICISHEISKITGALTKHAIPSEWKALLRNFIIFCLILLPVCISHGVLSI